jgi:hypothetical protein
MVYYIYWFMDQIVVDPLPAGGTQITAISWRMQRHAPGELRDDGRLGQRSLWTWFRRWFVGGHHADQDLSRLQFLRDILGSLNSQGSDLAEAFVAGMLTDTPLATIGDADSSLKM